VLVPARETIPSTRRDNSLDRFSKFLGNARDYDFVGRGVGKPPRNRLNSLMPGRPWVRVLRRSLKQLKNASHGGLASDRVQPSRSVWQYTTLAGVE